jgi:hypothetical protein
MNMMNSNDKINKYPAALLETTGESILFSLLALVEIKFLFTFIFFDIFFSTRGTRIGTAPKISSN